MITRNEKAKGLWWRLLATLSVLAILLIANTKVAAQEKKAVDKPIKVEMGQFEIFGDDGAPMQLKDTVIYADDGSYVKFETSDSFQPESGEPCKKVTVTSYDADGAPRNNFFICETEKRGDTVRYSIEPFSISGSLFETLLDVATSKEDTVYQIVEKMPQYPGGDEAMMKYVADNIKYPQEAKDKEIAGRVFVGFVIEKDGSVSNVKVVRGIGGGCDEEAARVIKSMPKWIPGMQKGKPVRVNYMIPIYFKLSDGQPSNGLDNTKWKGTGTGKKDGTNYTMKMDMEFESKIAGYFVMTLIEKNGENATAVFEDVGLPFTYTYDGKSSGSIQPTNPDGSQLGDEPMAPYGFLMNKNGTITVSFYDFKNDIGVEEIVFKKQ